MVRKFSALALAIVALIPTRAEATHPTVGLGTADSFAVLGGPTVTNTGPTVVNGNLGVSPGNAVVGFTGPPNGTVNGTTHAGDAVAAQAQSDLTTAYNDAAGRACGVVLTGQDLGGKTLTAGVYCYSSSSQLTGALTLDAQGNPNAVFIFKIGSTLTTASNSSVRLINSAQACNIFWQVGTSATLGTTTDFKGSILAQESITANTSTTLEGRFLARTAAVTLDTNTINRPTCAHPVGETRRRRGRGSTAGRGTTGTGEELARTGPMTTEQTLALGIGLILTGWFYNYLGASSTGLALALKGYQPKRLALRLKGYQPKRRKRRRR